jgi:ATP-binding cassette subfamily C protein LapB
MTIQTEVVPPADSSSAPIANFNHDLLRWIVAQYPTLDPQVEVFLQDPEVTKDHLLAFLNQVGFQCIIREQRSVLGAPKHLAEILWNDSYPTLIDPHHFDESGLMKVDLATGSYELVDLDWLAQAQECWEVYPPLSIDQRADHPHLKNMSHWFWDLVKPLYPVYGYVLLGSVFINIFAIFSSVFSMNVYDRVVPNGAVETLYTLSIGMVVLYSFDLGFKVLRSLLLDSANKKIDFALSSMIFEHLLQIPLSLRPKSLGGFSSLVTQFESFREFFASATLATLVDLPFMVLFIGMIWYMGGSLVWTVLITVPLIAAITAGTQWACYGRVRTNLRQSGQKNALLIEALGSLESIKFWGAQAVFQRRWDSALKDSATIHAEIKSIQTISSYLCQVVQSLSYVLMIVYGVLMILKGQLSMGALIGCSILSSRALAPVLQIGQLVLRWHHAKSSYEGMNNLMKMPSETLKNPLSVHGLQGVFEFSHVKFRYGEDLSFALDDVSFTLKPGNRLGVIGANGSGKSTLLKMLLGLYTPTEGQVRLDGFDLRQFHLTGLRQIIGYVPQDVQLIHGTLRDNMIIGCHGVSQQRLIEVAQQTGIMEWIGGHPKGFDMVIEERGQNLSGGQRQAIALARALMSDPKIFVLDEPTSALDFQAESEFLKRLEVLLPGKTLILISHRQAPLQLCQEVLALQNGKVLKRHSLQFNQTQKA